ncbi:hypothetical protein BDV98DRAFT_605747 [Pterulicium gracile]|uniref:Ricin B lectin domain-containing protein n=1 Tax=Pterulicium gracile TaxID=1884261 RepID=A0A5C3QD08_9AGAR|nr:hypothetical protein BDV98DRAFT_605747 [Pterula gracilis]
MSQSLRSGTYLIKNVHSDRYIISSGSDGYLETKTYPSESVPTSARIRVAVDEDRLFSLSSTVGDSNLYMADEWDQSGGFRHAQWNKDGSKWVIEGNGKPGQYIIKLVDFSLFVKQKTNSESQEYEPLILTSDCKHSSEAWMFVCSD